MGVVVVVVVNVVVVVVFVNVVVVVVFLNVVVVVVVVHLEEPGEEEWVSSLLFLMLLFLLMLLLLFLSTLRSLERRGGWWKINLYTLNCFVPSLVKSSSQMF